MSAVQNRKKAPADKDTKTIQSKNQEVPSEKLTAQVKTTSRGLCRGLVGLLLGLVLGLVATAVAYESYGFKLERLHECEQVSSVLKSFGVTPTV